MASLRRLSLLWVLALAAVLAGKAMLPSGWMPVAHGGEIRIALCNGQGDGFVTIARDGDAAQPGVPDDGVPRDICPFATTALAALLPQAPAPVALPTLVVLAPPPLHAIAVVPLPQGPRPPARGPPVSA